MRQADDQRKSIAQRLMQKSTELRRIIVPMQGRGHIVVRVPTLPPLSACKSHLVGVDEAWSNIVTGGVQRAAASATGKIRTGILFIQEAKVFLAHMPVEGFRHDVATGGSLLGVSGR